MKTVSLLILAIAVPVSGGSLSAQSPVPGGVSAPVLWLSAPSGNTPGSLYDHVSGKSVPTRRAGVSLNGNPAVYMDVGDTLPSIAPASPERFTFVAVYSQDDTLEHPLFSLHSGDSAILLATAARLAELKEADYLNYGKSRRQGIYLYTHRRNFDSLSVDKLLLHIARQPKEKLPVTGYSGAVPEVLLYNRILTLSERRRIQSCLSIKYGISMEQDVFPNSYYSASGEEIWNASRLGACSVRITGIGRDDLSGLRQTRSTNADAPGLPHVALDEAQTLPDRAFLLWGDNGGGLGMERQQGLPARLQRQWMSQASGDMAGLSTRMSFSTVHFRELPGKGEFYWLAVDRSGTGRYPAGQTAYRRCDTREGNAAAFHNLRWDTPNTVFTLMQAPAFFVRSETAQGYCRSDGDGSITLQCVGGTAPYRIVLEKDGHVLYRHAISDSLHTFSRLAAARYSLTVTDAAGSAYRDTLYLAHADAPQVTLAAAYTLEDGTVEINPQVSPGEGIAYAWERAGKTVSRSPQLTAAAPGAYTLTVRDAGGCTGMAQTQVKEEQRRRIRDILLYPNPTADGRFCLRIRLSEPLPVTVGIYDVQGRLLRKEPVGPPSDFHVYEGRETRPGVYLVKVQAGDEAQSVKLTVNR
jgi:hypothetical protein